MTRYEIDHRFYIRHKNKYRRYFQKNRKHILAYHRRYWWKHHAYLLHRQRLARAKQRAADKRALRQASDLIK